MKIASIYFRTCCVQSTLLWFAAHTHSLAFPLCVSELSFSFMRIIPQRSRNVQTMRSWWWHSGVVWFSLMQIHSVYSKKSPTYTKRPQREQCSLWSLWHRCVTNHHIKHRPNYASPPRLKHIQIGATHKNYVQRARERRHHSWSGCKLWTQLHIVSGP